MPNQREWLNQINSARTDAEVLFRERELAETWAGWYVWDWGEENLPDEIPPWWKAGCAAAAIVGRASAIQLYTYLTSAGDIQEYIEFAVRDAAESQWDRHVWANDCRLLLGYRANAGLEAVRRAAFTQEVRAAVNIDNALKRLYLAAWKRQQTGEGPSAEEVLNPDRETRRQPADGASRPDGVGPVSKKRGPKPNIEEAVRVREMVKDALYEECGEAWEHQWRSGAYIEVVADALDADKAIRPRTWRERQPPLQTWADALEKEKPVFVKAVDHYLRRAKTADRYPPADGLRQK